MALSRLMHVLKKTTYLYNILVLRIYICLHVTTISFVGRRPVVYPPPAKQKFCLVHKSKNIPTYAIKNKLWRKMNNTYLSTYSIFFFTDVAYRKLLLKSIHSFKIYEKCTQILKTARTIQNKSLIFLCMEQILSMESNILKLYCDWWTLKKNSICI